MWSVPAMRRVPAPHPGAGHPARWVFAALALILVAVMPPSNVSSDGASMYAVTDGLLRGTLHVPCQAGVRAPGGCVSPFYPLMSFAMVPFAVIGHAIAAVGELPEPAVGGLVSLLVPALSTAAAGALCFSMAMRLRPSRRRAILAAVTCALGTEMLTYSRNLFAEALGAAFLSCAVWGVLAPPSWRRTAGLIACTACVLTKPQLGLAVLCIAIAVALHDRRPRPALDVLAALALGVALYLIYFARKRSGV